MQKVSRGVIGWLIMVFSIIWAASGFAASPEKFTDTGEVKMLSVKAKTFSLQREGKEDAYFLITDATMFKRAKDIKEITVGDRLTVDYVVDNNANVAVSITKMIANLPKGVGTITTADLEALVEKGPESGKYVLIDARSAAKYTGGHIRTAISVPYSDLAANPAKYLPADKNLTLIFYCEGLTCDMSAKSAGVAVNTGYTKVLVYPEGERGWKKTEYCIATSVEYIRDGNLILVDLRDPEAVKEGHIPRAVNIPIQKLKDAESLFPEYKGAPIVFYGNKVEDLKAAVNLARDWEYKNVSAFSGGVEEWKSKGLQLEKGPAPTTISYVRKFSPHEMGASEFKKIVDTDTYHIIDVRTKDEFAKGHFRNAVNLPLEELLRKSGEIPKNKPVLVHCSTGTRAEMAFEILKEKGFQVNYLNATIEFGRDNKYQITE